MVYYSDKFIHSFNSKMFTSFVGERYCSIRMSDSCMTTGSGFIQPSDSSVICTPRAKALWGRTKPESILDILKNINSKKNVMLSVDFNISCDLSRWICHLKIYIIFFFNLPIQTVLRTSTNFWTDIIHDDIIRCASTALVFCISLASCSLALKKIFEKKKCVSIDSKCSETHRNVIKKIFTPLTHYALRA